MCSPIIAHGAPHVHLRLLRGPLLTLTAVLSVWSMTLGVVEGADQTTANGAAVTSAPIAPSATRLAAVETLARQGAGNDAIADRLLQAAQDEDWAVRAAAVRSLAGASGERPALVRGLTERFGDKDVRVRINAAHVAGRIKGGAAQIAPGLIPLLYDEDWRVQEGALRSIATIGAPASPAISEITKLLNHSRRDVASAAAQALLRINPAHPLVVESFRKALQSERLATRQIAAVSLGEMGEVALAAIPDLIPVVSDEDHFVQIAAALALARLSRLQESASNALLDTARNGKPTARMCAVWALGVVAEFRAEAAIPAIRQAQSDEDHGVQAVAREVMKHLALWKHIDLADEATRGAAAPSPAGGNWSLERAPEWRRAQSASKNIALTTDGLSLDDAAAGAGEWTSVWHDVSTVPNLREIRLRVALRQFEKKRIETVIEGASTPYVDQDQIPHDWYGRCTIVILDRNRWIMALRSGVNHIDIGGRDTLHILTSNDEGRTWGKLNHWFDGTPIAGMPYEDGHTHSETGLYLMPNGDLILQFWRTWTQSGTKQLRSTDQGKTWTVDSERVEIAGVTHADGNMALGTQDYFIDPESPNDVYMAFEYFRYGGGQSSPADPREGQWHSGTLLTRSSDNGRSWHFLSWIGPLAPELPGAKATFEPAIEYLGQRRIVAVLRDSTRSDGRGKPLTWQTYSDDMGASFAPLVDIAPEINRGGLPNGTWGRPRLFMDSNPRFQYEPSLSFSRGEGWLWGFGLYAKGGGFTRTPAVFASANHGQSWHGPEILHGPIYPGADSGYGDIKRRVDGTYVAITYYGSATSHAADLEQYTFGGQRVKIRLEADRDGDGRADYDSGWRELLDGENVVPATELAGKRWRFSLALTAAPGAAAPRVLKIAAQ